MKNAPAIAPDTSQLSFLWPAEAVSILVISAAKEDHLSIQKILDHPNWKIHEAHSYRQALAILCADRMPVVVCESCLPDGNWRDILGQVAVLMDPPRLIVISLHADDHLWAEVLSMGGYDVLPKPLDPSEVLRVVSLAWRNWQQEWEQRNRRWKPLAKAGAA